MITVRPADQRGHFNHGWLDTYHTFSFAGYHDPRHMGFRALRVMNDDRVAPGMGFGMHPHRDMEIVTWVLEGALEHKDSMGHGAVLRPGEAQRISAGTGILHSEFNPSPSAPVHLYQIWLLPNERGHQPSYAQQAFPKEARQGRWQPIVTPDGRDGSLTMHQDAVIQLADLSAGAKLHANFAPGRHAWLQVLRGEVKLGAISLHEGDGAALSEEANAVIQGVEGSELMWFDLA